MLSDAGSGLHRWFVWSTTAVIGIAFLLWLSDILVGLVVVVGILYAAVHLISRSGTATGKDPSPDGRDTANGTLSRASRTPPRSTLDILDSGTNGKDEDDDDYFQRQAQADAEIDAYYAGLAADARGCAADDGEVFEPEAFDGGDGAAEGLGPGEDEDGRW